MRGVLLMACFGALLVFASPAAADDWYPHPADALWTWQWTDSVYSPTPTNEKVTVKETKNNLFTLTWTTVDQGNPPDAVASVGTMEFQDSLSGLYVTNWASSVPPPQFPILCAQPANCGNTLTSALYNLAWGSRAPLLVEPLLRDSEWGSTGGTGNDVASVNTYAGVETLKVPAFADPVTAVKVRSEITQAGALGDPYGSGVRTVWWVYGVGPVKIVFEHSGGSNAAVTTATLQTTNQAAKPPPVAVNYFPLKKGLKGTYRWTNAKHFTKPVVQSFVIDQVQNASARIAVKSVSGPIRVVAAYGFTSRMDGITNIWGVSRAQSLAKLPKLGPASLPASKRRHFFTPFDLATFGFNPLIPAYPAAGASWAAATSGRDFSLYGVTGSSRIVGVQKVKVPAGTFTALVVKTTMTQKGFPFGSGARTSWFAPDRGLVKLVFRHGDGSTSQVELVKK